MSVEKYIGGGVFAAYDWEAQEMVLRKPCKGGDHFIELNMDMLKEIDAFMCAIMRLLRKKIEAEEQKLMDEFHHQVQRDIHEAMRESDGNIEWLFGKPKH